MVPNFLYGRKRGGRYDILIIVLRIWHSYSHIWNVFWLESYWLSTVYSLECSLIVILKKFKTGFGLLLLGTAQHIGLTTFFFLDIKAPNQGMTTDLISICVNFFTYWLMGHIFDILIPFSKDNYINFIEEPLSGL